MSKEIELKYCLDESKFNQILSDPWLRGLLSSPMREIQMESSYFDTPTRTLQDSHITFRMRRENDEIRFTVKTPGDRHERGEWEVSAAAPEEAISALAAIGAPQLPPPPYQVCACARFLRRTARIAVSETLEIELCLDCGTLGFFPFCELELELKHGTKAELEAFGALIATRFALTPEPLSKFARARLSQK